MVSHTHTHTHTHSYLNTHTHTHTHMTAGLDGLIGSSAPFKNFDPLGFAAKVCM